MFFAFFAFFVFLGRRLREKERVWDGGGAEGGGEVVYIGRFPKISRYLFRDKYLDICFAGDFRGKISRENIPGKYVGKNISGKYPGKYVGKISRENTPGNMSGKYLGKISRENMCRENISGKYLMKISHENISWKYLSWIYLMKISRYFILKISRYFHYSRACERVCVSCSGSVLRGKGIPS